MQNSKGTGEEMINISLAAITDFPEYLRTKRIRIHSSVNMLVRNRTLQFRMKRVRGGVKILFCVPHRAVLDSAVVKSSKCTV